MRWAVYSQPTPSHPAGCKDRELSQARPVGHWGIAVPPLDPA
jgi:hypothetical protein